MQNRNQNPVFNLLQLVSAIYYRALDEWERGCEWNMELAHESRGCNATADPEWAAEIAAGWRELEAHTKLVAALERQAEDISKALGYETVFDALIEAEAR